MNFVKHQYNLLRRKFPATSFTGSPVLSHARFDLLNKLLTYDPEKWITAEAALNHDGSGKFLFQSLKILCLLCQLSMHTIGNLIVDSRTLIL
ncbi:hypothetical protein L1887_17742 [Cichorium endivia]|nr:hypothetical protein L1887_17742 [Cichorium endivia]